VDPEWWPVSPARNIQGQAADEQRFTRLAETTGPRVLAYLSRRVDPPGDAADVLAEVLATAWRRVADLPADDEEAAAWLFGIARGTLANYRRGQTRRHALADRLRAHLEHRLREAAPPADETVAVRDALTRLPADDRELLTLVAWDGLRTDEAAALLGITPAAARQRLVRARRRLRAKLDEATGPTPGDSGPATFTPTDTWPRAPAKR
jgi:RNA polymerase sigma factor (sigma-70 family)